MTHHTALWETIKYIAEINQISCSCLARKCNLDATTFNHSKRLTKYGQPRWISTETLAKVLVTTHTSPVEFAQILQTFLDQE